MDKGLCLNGRHHSKKLRYGTGRKVRSGADVAILTVGHIGNEGMRAAERLAKENCDACIV